MRLLRFIRWLAGLCIGLAFIAIGVLSIVGGIPSWPWFIPGGVIVLAVIVLVSGDRSPLSVPAQPARPLPSTPLSSTPLPPTPPRP